MKRARDWEPSARSDEKKFLALSVLPYYDLTWPVVDARSPLCVTSGGTSVLNRPTAHTLHPAERSTIHSRRRNCQSRTRISVKELEPVAHAEVLHRFGSVDDSVERRTRRFRDHAWISPSHHFGPSCLQSLDILQADWKSRINRY